eukprot:m.144902 g.144902  ORF g.144902 m.144902 type:complete len:456 (-) comp17725_c0_seq1:243-1610(-)
MMILPIFCCRFCILQLFFIAGLSQYQDMFPETHINVKFWKNNTEDSWTPRIYVYKPPRHLEDVLGLSLPAIRTYFQLETKLLELMSKRGRLVTDPNSANVFWVPHTLVGHWIEQRGSHHSTESESLVHYWNHGLKPFLQHIYHNLPYFNKTGGLDHVFVYVMDEGPVCETGHNSHIFAEDPEFKRIVHPMIHVGYYGTSMQPRDKDLRRLSAVRQSCWQETHDIQLPQWNQFHHRNFGHAHTAAARLCLDENNCKDWSLWLKQRASEAKVAFFFRGNSVPGRCSIGIRPWLFEFCKTHSGWCAHEGDMRGAVFAFCPGGWACWSSRYYDACEVGTIPIRLADGIIEPFAEELNYPAFSDTITTGNPVDIPITGEAYRHLERMHAEWKTWRQACLPENDNLPGKDCIVHPISLKLASLSLVQPWLSWEHSASVTAPSAARLFEHYLRKRVRTLAQL